MWQVMVKKKIIKLLKDRSMIPEDVDKAVKALIADLSFGPSVNKPNYGKLKQSSSRDLRHCHLQRGKPTWVACWEVYKTEKVIEVYYVGTHEKAPY